MGALSAGWDSSQNHAQQEGLFYCGDSPAASGDSRRDLSLESNHWIPVTRGAG